MQISEEKKNKLRPAPIDLEFVHSSEDEDEIDLVELLRILWHRRWLMLGVFAFIVGLAVAYCFYATPKYEITAQMSPGITGYNENENPVSAWSVNDIQNWFAQEGYREGLIELFGDDAASLHIKANNNRGSNLVNVSIAWPDPEQGKKVLFAAIESLTKMGNQKIQQLILSRQDLENKVFQLDKEKEQISIERNRLNDSVKKKQQNLAVDTQKFEYEILKLEKALEQIPIDRSRLENQILKAKNKLNVFNTQLISIEKNKLLAKKAADNIKNRLDRVNNNTEELIKLRKNTFSGDGNSDKLALLMYSNIVQQNISFAINLQRRIEELEKEINNYLDEESGKKSELDDIRIEIQNLELTRDKELLLKESEIKKNILKLKADLNKTINVTEIEVQELLVRRKKELSIKEDNLHENNKTMKTRLSTLSPIEINQRPFSSPGPIQPAKAKIIILAFALACFLAMISAFIYEFWRKNRKRIKASHHG